MLKRTCTYQLQDERIAYSAGLKKRRDGTLMTRQGAFENVIAETLCALQLDLAVCKRDLHMSTCDRKGQLLAWLWHMCQCFRYISDQRGGEIVSPALQGGENSWHLRSGKLSRRAHPSGSALFPCTGLHSAAGAFPGELVSCDPKRGLIWREVLHPSFYLLSLPAVSPPHAYVLVPLIAYESVPHRQHNRDSARWCSFEGTARWKSRSQEILAPRSSVCVRNFRIAMAILQLFASSAAWPVMNAHALPYACRPGPTAIFARNGNVRSLFPGKTHHRIYTDEDHMTQAVEPLQRDQAYPWHVGQTTGGLTVAWA